MSLPQGFATPEHATTSLPLHVVTREGFASWRDAQPAPVQTWLAAQRFDGNAGTAQSWADADGRLAGAVIGISARSHVFEKNGPPGYEDGIPSGSAVNILTAGFIYLPVWEAVAIGDALRYFKSGANAGLWGKTASAGNSLLFPSGNWSIRKGAGAGQVIQVEFNFPAGVSVTAD